MRAVAYLILGLEVAFLLGFVSCHPGQMNPQGYSCSPQPCSADVFLWSGVPTAAGSFPPSIPGYSSSIYIAQMSGGDGFISNSLKLVSSINNGFVEVGYLTQGVVDLSRCGQPGTYYFWTDFGTAGPLVFHCVGAVPQADFGKYTEVVVYNIANNAAVPTFGISIFSPSETLTTSCDGTTPCAEALWTPGNGFADVQLGETLVGTQGASADAVLFTPNCYQPLQPVPWPYQSADGGVTSANPPYGFWVQTPSTSGSSGGSFYTECCLPPSTVYPAGLNFGTVTVGTKSAVQAVTVTNLSSTGTLSITGISITGTNARDFVIGSPTTCAAGGSLAPLAGCMISITFTPSVQGSESATLAVTDSGGSGSGSDNASLSGVGQ